MFTSNIDITRFDVHHGPMRTTLSIDDEVLELVKQYAEDRSMTVGDAVTELIRKAFRTPTPTKMLNGLRVFDLPAGTPRITSKRVKELELEDK
jgi:hypothetical protein